MATKFSDLSASTGSLVAPVLTFVRSAGELSDPQILESLGYRQYRTLDRSIGEANLHYTEHGFDMPYPWVAITNDAVWTAIAECRYGALNREALRALGECFDVFAFATMDCDNSIEIEYYQDTCLRRRILIDEPWGQPGPTEFVGDPLPGEIDLLPLDRDGRIEAALSIAASLGAITRHDLGSVRTYQIARTPRN